MQTASEICFQLPPLPGERGSRHRRLFQALHPPLPRIARLLALAIHLDRMMARQDLDCRQIANPLLVAYFPPMTSTIRTVSTLGRSTRFPSWFVYAAKSISGWTLFHVARVGTPLPNA